ncbi:MAG: ABC transporter permease [Bacteroidaceae bacterium]|nr:ABC transporter permease [Bacteroidaceae bacterium]
MRKILFTYIHELKSCISDIGVMVFLLLVPAGYPLLYSYIYSQEVVRDIPVATVDHSQSSLSRTFLRNTDATPDVSTAYSCTDLQSARRLMKENKVKGIIYIPQNFEDNIKQGEQAHISIFCSMASFFYYKAILVACTEVSLSMNTHIQASELTGATAQEIKITTSPLPSEAVGLSNHSTGFANFVIPAILMLVLQQIQLLGIGMRMGTEYERRGTTKRQQPVSNIIGCSAAYLTISAPVAAYVLCIVPHIFGLSQLANGATLTLFMLPYLLASIFLAITIGNFIHSREMPMMLFVFTSIPLLFLSGISWPGSNIPLFWKIISYIFPSTPGINGFVAINNMGANLADVSTEYCILWMQTIIYFITSVISQKSKQKESTKNRQKKRLSRI